MIDVKRTFSVNIKKTLEKVVEIEADTIEDAINEAERKWMDGAYTLDESDVTAVEFLEW